MRELCAAMGIFIVGLFLGAALVVDGIGDTYMKSCLNTGHFQASEYTFVCKIKEPASHD